MSDAISETVLALQAENELLKKHPLICPHCQRKIGDQDTVEALGSEWGLTITEQKIFEMLYRKFGRLVTYEAIFDVLYGHDPNGGPVYGLKMISVYFHKLRNKLPANYHLATVWARGGILSKVDR